MADGEEEDSALDFSSPHFDASRALSTPDIRLPVPGAESYQDLNTLREAVHGQEYSVVREDVPGVRGPGGIPRPMVRQVPAGRNFTPEQGLLAGRGRRKARNVLTRMEEMKGPLATLTECQQRGIRIKVYTRGASGVRGILTGTVVAFDKHWNLALQDVDEVFTRRLRAKTPVLGDVSKYISVANLSIRDSPPEAPSSDSDSEGDEGAKYKPQGSEGRRKTVREQEEEEEGGSGVGRGLGRGFGRESEGAGKGSGPGKDSGDARTSRESGGGRRRGSEWTGRCLWGDGSKRGGTAAEEEEAEAASSRGSRGKAVGARESGTGNASGDYCTKSLRGTTTGGGRGKGGDRGRRGEGRDRGEGDVGRRGEGRDRGEGDVGRRGEGRDRRGGRRGEGRLGLETSKFGSTEDGGWRRCPDIRARLSYPVNLEYPGTSEAQDARRLMLGDGGRRRGERDPGGQGGRGMKDGGGGGGQGTRQRGRKTEKKKKRMKTEEQDEEMEEGELEDDDATTTTTEDEEGDVQEEEKNTAKTKDEDEDVGGGEEEEGGGAKEKRGKKTRKRKREEMRRRHVNQLLVRGENVVLITVLRP